MSAKNGGSMNPIVFHDYESFVAKFQDVPKTTDDCYTPEDVYNAVVEYVDSHISLRGKQILRPFYPGGDYEHAEYPDNGIVIDNPPFSMFTKICKFYCERNIPFFLFGPGLTIGTIFHICTAVIIGTSIRFHNGANVKCNFATNLFGDVVAMTAPALDKAIRKCQSQNIKKQLPHYSYPENVLSVSDMQTMASGGVPFVVYKEESARIRNLQLHPKKGGLFGDHLLVSDRKAAAKAAAINAIPIMLSDDEQIIVDSLE